MRWLLLLLPLLFLLGCIELFGEQEEKLKKEQDIGVLSVGFIRPVVPENSTTYFSIVIRNNKLGKEAKNIVVSIDNVDPFELIECEVVRDPNETRNVWCIRLYDLDNPAAAPHLRWRQHGVSAMMPGEEIDFFWKLRSPAAVEIADMSYEHKIHYTIEYEYSMLVVKQLYAMTFEEFYRRTRAEEEVIGPVESTAGPIQIEFVTDEPIRYILGEETDFTFILFLKNVGEGSLKPESVLNLTMIYNAECLDLLSEATWKGETEGMRWREVSPTALIPEYRLVIQFKLLMGCPTTFPFLVIPLEFRMEYVYMLSGEATVEVYPHKV